MRMSFWMVLAFACNSGTKDEGDTDLSTDTDAAADTDVATDTDVAADTDVATDTDVVVDTDTTAHNGPSLPNTSGSNYTVYYDGSALNIYWIAAFDDVTASDALEYKVTCRLSGQSAQVTTDWTVATEVPVEASSRYWRPACTGPVGTHEAWVSVRDEAGNVTDYPVLSGAITPNAFR